MVRTPAVAGLFYEGEPELLKKQIEEVFTHPLGPGKLPKAEETIGTRRIIGLVSPHAGYIYSGPIAAHGFLELAKDGKPDVFVILGPNHTGLGSPVSTMIDDWYTPLGKVFVDKEFAKEIAKRSEIVDIDPVAHRYEHSIEVQLPFLQFIYGEIFFVPITMMWQTPEVAGKVAKAVFEASKDLGKDVVIIASTDLNHYEPQDITVKKDKLAIDAILEMNSEKLYKTVEGYDISMCGPGPTMVLVEYANLIGNVEAKLLKHATSGDITGDTSAVVGYASIVFRKKS